MTSHDEHEALTLRLQERALLMGSGKQSSEDGQIAPDRLVLADATLLAALAGARPLTPSERVALAASPLTLRRFRHLSLQRRAAALPGSAVDPAAAARAGVTADAVSTIPGGGAPAAATAANDARWSGSTGMLRAASTAPATLASVVTDDNCWTLHFVARDGGWQVILALSAQAPFAARLLNEQPLLRVIDGAGATVLQGRLDADGECECGWPFDTAPALHFQQHGAGFTVQPAASAQPGVS